MDFDDISAYPHGERTRRFLLSNFGKTGASPDLTVAEVAYAKELATEEMLDEIHFMLRTLCNGSD